MKYPDWCRENIFYFYGMTPEDYLYLQYVERQTGNNTITKLQRGEAKLPPISQRTKEDVFTLVGADINYVFDINTMCKKRGSR